jgi:predicted phage-related endonuclease
MTSPTPEVVDLDPIANWVRAYVDAKQRLDEAQAAVDYARGKIEDALGDREVGLVEGRPAVTWRTVTSRRLDTTRVKVFLGADYDKWTNVTTSRRFEVKL